MTIDEAIKHAEEVAEEERQLAEWLKELKAVKQIIVQHDSDRMPEDYWYIDKMPLPKPYKAESVEE